MSDPRELWALEYSAVENLNGRFPYHMDLLCNAGRPPYHWKVVYVGKYERVYKKCEKLTRKLNHGG